MPQAPEPSPTTNLPSARPAPLPLATGGGRPAPGAWAMWAVAVAVYLTAVFHRSGLAVASLDAEQRFHIGPSVLAVFVAVQLGIYAAMQIPTGAMADRYGPRRMLLAAVTLMAVGEIAFALGHDAGTALLGRALVGFGDAVTFLSVLRLVQNWFPVSRYGLLAAFTSLVGGIGQLVSTVPLHAGLVHLGWTPMFAVSGLVTLAVGAPVWLALRDRPGPRVAPARREPPDRLVVAVREVMGRRGTWRGMWAHFSLTGPFAVFTALWGYPFLVRAEHYQPARASDALALVVVAAVLGAPPIGALMVRAPRHRTKVVYGAGGLLLGSWITTLAIGAGRDPAWVVIVLLVATGIGGPASAIAFDLARESNRHQRGGAATGVVNIGGFTGAVLADLVIGGLLDTVGHGGHSPAGFDWAMAVVPVMVAVGMAAFWWCGRPTDAGDASAADPARSDGGPPTKVAGTIG